MKVISAAILDFFMKMYLSVTFISGPLIIVQINNVIINRNFSSILISPVVK